MKTKILGLLAWPGFTAKLRGVKISSIGPKRAFALVAALFIVALCPQAHAQAGISLAIEKHARLTEQGAIVITVHIVCGPFEGVEEFQETIAGAFQAKTGAEAEGGNAASRDHPRSTCSLATRIEESENTEPLSTSQCA
jgi:hypothetical protein